MDLEKIFQDEYNAYSQIQHLEGDKVVYESMPCINKEKFIEVVKKLLIHNVSQQREELLLFKKWEQKHYWKPDDGCPELTVDTYLKSNIN